MEVPLHFSSLSRGVVGFVRERKVDIMLLLHKVSLSIQGKCHHLKQLNEFYLDTILLSFGNNSTSNRYSMTQIASLH